MEILAILLSVIIIILLLAVLASLRNPKKIDVPEIREMEQKLRFSLASESTLKEVQNSLRNLPNQVLVSITKSLGKRTGKLNELMATVELTQYDRLFYLGEPIDFIGIKYGEGVDFIEVKTGRFRLSEDEKRLRELIEQGRVNYVPLSVERVGIAEEIDCDYL